MGSAARRALAMLQWLHFPASTPSLTLLQLFCVFKVVEKGPRKDVLCLDWGAWIHLGCQWWYILSLLVSIEILGSDLGSSFLFIITACTCLLCDGGTMLFSIGSEIQQELQLHTVLLTAVRILPLSYATSSEEKRARVLMNQKLSFSTAHHYSLRNHYHGKWRFL